MRILLLIALTALTLAACATAATEAPPLPTLATTLPASPVPDSQQTGGDQPTPEPDTQATPVDAGAVTQPVVEPTSAPLIMSTQDAQEVGGMLVTPDLTQIAAAPTSAIQQAIGLLPPPGTAVVPVTEEVSVSNTAPFSEIYFEQSGGITGGRLSIQIFDDGRVIRDGVEGMVAPDKLAELNQLIQETNFFSIQGQFTSVGGSADVYKYLLRIELASGVARLLDAQDGLTPPELLRLFSVIRDVGA